jgi:hypothetical protein
MKPLPSTHSFAALLFAFMLICTGPPLTALAQNASPQQTKAVAKEAYVYGFPVVDLYRIIFGYFIDPQSPAFVSPFNKLYNTARVYTSADTTVQTPNSDTPYSFVGLDLRAEPLVLTLPAINRARYYSVQFVDQYTYNVAYAGSRTTGNDGGKFLIAGPNWEGAAPAGITKVIRYDTQFGLALIRTQLFGPSDLRNVKKIQAGYAVEPLSSFARTPAPPATAAIDWPPPLTPEEERTSSRFFNILTFVLQFCPAPKSEIGLRRRFASVGIAAGESFDAGSLAGAFADGMKAGQKTIDEERAAIKSTSDLFGTPEQMHDRYLDRAVGAQYGILGNSPAEAMYLGYTKGSDGLPLDGSKRYILHFPNGGLPPTKAFWSLTMYDLPQQLLVANPLNRYLINLPMLPKLILNTDGGLTLYIQHTSPGADKEPNWLPAPPGPFFIVLRDYWPQESVIDGSWKQPPITVAK